MFNAINKKMKKNKIKNFIIRNPYWSTLFVPFVGTIFFLFLFAYIKVLNLNSAIIILLGWIGWTIYCIVVCKGKRVILIFDTLFIWVLIFLLSTPIIFPPGHQIGVKLTETKSIHKKTITYITVEMMICSMGETTVMDGNLTCSGRTADSVIAAAVIAKDDVMNAYETDKQAVTSGGTNTSDSDAGYIRLSVSGENIIIKTCHTKPCLTKNQSSKTIAFQ